MIITIISLLSLFILILLFALYLVYKRRITAEIISRDQSEEHLEISTDILVKETNVWNCPQYRAISQFLYITINIIFKLRELINNLFIF